MDWIMRYLRQIVKKRKMIVNSTHLTCATSQSSKMRAVQPICVNNLIENIRSLEFCETQLINKLKNISITVLDVAMYIDSLKISSCEKNHLKAELFRIGNSYGVT